MVYAFYAFYVVMAHVVMARVVMHNEVETKVRTYCYGLHSYGVCSHGLCSNGLCSNGLCSYGLCSFGLCTYGLCTYAQLTRNEGMYGPATTCIGMSVHMGTDMCVNMCIHMGTDMCIDWCIGTSLLACMHAVPIDPHAGTPVYGWTETLHRLKYCTEQNIVRTKMLRKPNSPPHLCTAVLPRGASLYVHPCHCPQP